MAPLEPFEEKLNFNLNVNVNNAENDEEEDALFEDVHQIHAGDANAVPAAPSPPPPHVAAGAEDSDDDILDAEELYAFGILTPPASPPHFHGFPNLAEDDEEADWVPEEGILIAEPLAPGNGHDPIDALQLLGEYLDFLELMEALQNGGPGNPQVPIPAASGSLDPPQGQNPDDDEINDVD